MPDPNQLVTIPYISRTLSLLLHLWLMYVNSCILRLSPVFGCILCSMGTRRGGAWEQC